MSQFSKSPFDSVEEAVIEIAKGSLVIVTDDKNRENEGDLVMAASKATPETVNMNDPTRSRSDLRSDNRAPIETAGA